MSVYWIANPTASVAAMTVDSATRTVPKRASENTGVRPQTRHHPVDQECQRLPDVFVDPTTPEEPLAEREHDGLANDVGR